MSSIHVCGPMKSDKPGYGKCICCLNDFPYESMAVNMCWDCVTGNFDCQNCLSSGVPVDRFPYKRGKEHRFKEWIFLGGSGEIKVALTHCGLYIHYDEIGQGIAVRKWCKSCWPNRRI